MRTALQGIAQILDRPKAERKFFSHTIKGTTAYTVVFAQFILGYTPFFYEDPKTGIVLQDMPPDT